MWQLAFFLGPLCFLLALSFWSVESFRLTPDFTSANWDKVYAQAYFWRALGVTILYAVLGSLLVSLLAFPAAFHIAFRLSPQARRLALMLIGIPFFTSYLVRIYSWQVYLGDSGIINNASVSLGIAPLNMLNTAFGTFVGYATLCLPLVLLLQVFGLSQVPQQTVNAAHNLGCGPVRIIYKVVIPGARAGLAIAALFAFILIFGDFASPIYLGGANAQTLSILITDLTKAGQQWPRAAVVAVTMIVVLLATAFATLRFAYQARK